MQIDDILALNKTTMPYKKYKEVANMLAKSPHEVLRKISQKLQKESSAFIEIELSDNVKKALQKLKNSTMEGVRVKEKKPEKEVMSLAEAKSVNHETITLPEKYASVIGKPTKRAFSILAHGKQGCGKTTYMLPLADFLAANYGKTVYVTSEEFDTGTLAQKINDLKIKSPNLDFAVSLAAINPNNYKCIFIDSKDNIGLKIDYWREIKRKYPETSFVIISQATKQGNFRGSQEWPHELDCHITMDNGVASTVGNKNRYGQHGEWDIFNRCKPIKDEE
ncbi:hypothetical protein SAMN05421780_11036 [Flexibacter flexilis DSM 6793]|uniref:AAA domain-containing protein n=1 Tax=Flexibacter flexilis DSM 6793 TaxID=927664 RepID=A0A1I1MG18_9BACT|nr:hypothetical protein [Flexibacter flexilis]SFC80540.1 hypothetical protein SAMN05421780_11036 [Flexibacter flexilis DSM 6793]